MDQLTDPPTRKDSPSLPAHWRQVVDGELWAYEIKLDGERLASGSLTGKGLPVLDRIVALVPAVLIEHQHASSLEISMDCVPF